jgi:uroporphyrinogen decarboxylase
METKMTKPILDVLQRRTPSRVPFWLMRQAGRYLPEYRDLRSYTTGFLDLVYDPIKAAEITLQPIRRYGMDAAILFSDILVVPHALGQTVEFRAGEGPVLDPLYVPEDFKILDVQRAHKKFAPVYETVSRVRKMLSDEGFDEVALIGFSGGVWTVICYMLEGHGSRDFEAARRWALRDPASFQQLVDIVSEATIEYLCGQVEAGVEALQIFESWGGILDPDQFARWVIAPTKKIIDAVKAKHPNVPIIGFPRGAGVQSLAYAKNTSIDAIGIDYTLDPKWAVENLQTLMPVQGNLDPVRLLAGGKALEDGLHTIHETLGQGPFIFNLGHGVIKSTDVENVQHLTDIVRGWSK